MARPKKTDAQIAHEERNAKAAEAAAARKAQRIADHQARNQTRKVEAIVEAARNGKGVEDLAATFAPLAAAKDWRFDVDATVTGPMNDNDYAQTLAAIAFFTCVNVDQIGAIREETETTFSAEGFWWNGMRAPTVANDVVEAVEAAATAAGFAQESDILYKAA